MSSIKLTPHAPNNTQDNTFTPDFLKKKNRRVSAIYQVIIRAGTGNVEIRCVGMECVDSECSGNYTCIEDTPEWVQERIAVLSIMPYSNLDGDGNVSGSAFDNEIEGIGTRLGAHNFLVIPSHLW